MYNDRERQENWQKVHAHPSRADVWDNRNSEIYKRIEKMTGLHRARFGIGCAPDDRLQIVMYVLGIKEDRGMAAYEKWCDENPYGCYKPTPSLRD